MDFINRGFSSILIIAFIFIAIVFLINILPVILLIGAGIWGISYVYKKIKAFLKSKDDIFNNKTEDVEIINNIDFSESNVIDVDYTEVK
jgi:hypothetical protein